VVDQHVSANTTIIYHESRKAASHWCQRVSNIGGMFPVRFPS